MTPLPARDIIWIDPDRVSGEPCFRGTRVPVRAYFAHLATGATIDEFLDSFVGVRREQVVSLLKRGMDGVVDAVAADLDPDVRDELERRWQQSRPDWESWELIEEQIRERPLGHSDLPAPTARAEAARAGAA